MSEKKSECKAYECNECKFVTVYLNSYKRHVANGKHNTKHNNIITKKKKEKKEKIPEIFKCNKCEYTSIYKHNRDNHYLKQHASEQERKKHFSYYCDACCFGTKSISGNKHHINSVDHNRRIGPYLEIQKKLQAKS